MAEEQALHRRELEKQVLDAQIADAQSQRRETMLGQVLGFAAAILLIGAGFWIATKDSATWVGVASGSALSGVTLIGLVTVFVQGRKHLPSEPPHDELTQPDTQSE